MIKNNLKLHNYMLGGKRFKSFSKSKLSSSKKKSSILSKIQSTLLSNNILSKNQSTSLPNESNITPNNIKYTKPPNEIPIPKTAAGIVKGFFQPNFMSFLKNYFFFIILFSICFYILLNIYNDSNNHVIIYESKVFFYLIIAFLFIIINDIMNIPLLWLDKFSLIILFSLMIEYLIINFIEYYYKGEPFHKKLYKVVLSSLIVGLVIAINIYFLFQLKNQQISADLFNSFNYAINKNSFFLKYLTIFLFFFYMVYYFFNLNTYLSNIFSPTILGLLLLFMIFSFIIYIVYRLKIINKLQILNGFISLASILFFFIIVFIYIFMNSLKTVCTTDISEQQLKENDIVSILILISIFIILWYDDSRNWHQRGSILFIFATIMTFYSMFYYSISHPSTSLLSTWLFIEWIIIFFKRKENSKNSFNFAFMKT